MFNELLAIVFDIGEGLDGAVMLVGQILEELQLGFEHIHGRLFEVRNKYLC